MYVDPIEVKIFMVALCASLSAVVALSTAILARFAGAQMAGAALQGGAAFGASLALALGVFGGL